MEKLRVVTYFYSLIEIPYDESALGLTTVLVKIVRIPCHCWSQKEKTTLFGPDVYQGPQSSGQSCQD